MLKAIVNSPVRSGNQTIVNGDLVIGTSGEGINFTANTAAAGMTSQLLNWYEEGTWTATISDGTTDATMSSNTCQYTRVGRQVTVCGYIATSSVAGLTGNLLVKGLPFTIANGLSYYSGGSVGTCGNLAITANQVVSIYGVVNTKTIDIRLWDAATGTTGLLPAEWTNTGNMVFSLTYFV